MDKISFAKRLSFLLKAGISLKDSLNVLVAQAEKRQLTLFSIILTDVSDGKYLSQSLIKYPAIFNPFAISIIKSGEESGLLSESLQRLAEDLTKRQQLQQKLISTLTYPACIAGATVLLSGFLLLFIFPKIKPLFTTMSVKLPLSTRILLALNSLLQHHGILIVSILIIVITSFLTLYKKYPQTRIILEKIILRIPIIKTLIIHYEIGLICYVLGSLLKSGTDIDTALNAITNISATHTFRMIIKESAEKVPRGIGLSHIFQTHKNSIPRLVTDICRAPAMQAG